MNKILLPFLFALLALPALCDTLSHSSGFELWAPDEWTRAERGDQLALLSPDGTCAMFLNVVESVKDEPSEGSLEERLGKAVGDVRVTEGPRDIAHNGLVGQSIQGRGSVDGVEVDCGITVFKVREASITIVLTCHSGSTAEHEPTMDRIMASLKAN